MSERSESNWIRPDVFELVRQAVSDGLERTREAIETKKFITKYYKFPEKDYFDSGLPHFSTKLGMMDDSPVQYSSIFWTKPTSEHEANVDPRLMESWVAFRDFAIRDGYLSNYWNIAESNAAPSDPIIDVGGPDFYCDFQVWRLCLAGLVDAYIHVFKKFEIVDLEFESLYSEWENSVFSERLLVEAAIPILCLNFSFDRLDITDRVRIERMDDGFQLGRINHGVNGHVPAYTLAGAATHAIFISGWSMENKTIEYRQASLSGKLFVKPFEDTINNFFAALRVQTAVETGYAQIITKPIGWTDRWTAWIPRVYPTWVREYPDHFEDYRWLSVPEVLGEEACMKIGSVMEALGRQSKFEIAVRRLNSAFLRRNEADSILDVTIGLESLFSDKEKTELVHKLAMRIGALGHIESYEGHSPSLVFTWCKKIYKFRSDVVHGSKVAEKDRTVELPGGSKIGTLQLGINLLRYAIRVLSDHPQYLDPVKLDHCLLGERINNAQ